ncbi:zeta toxin family protein [Shewanella fodinae]|uniref:zeta toxin family protein n=1 Tax=Shewanella fodinae TaxID=552357 RepID=UPI001676F6BE|nr:zeta toxin family protein [Shewanella fodinae]MCL2905775.1 zeta toxin family protein [Shewanella fodinae]GGY97020.1 hypothetical protein GCM10007169_12500 [Shewanella fodinae]
MVKEYSRPLDYPVLANTFLINVLEIAPDDAETYCYRLSNVEALLSGRRLENTLRSRKYRSPNCQSDEQRIKLRERIFEELYTSPRLENDEEIRLGNGGAMPLTDVKDEHEAYIIIGPPASGKSSLANKIADITGSYILDSDYAKRKFPEFNDPTGAGVLHEESSLVVFGDDGQYEDELNLKQAVTFFGWNIVIPKIGADVSKLRALRDSLIEDGYRVHLILISLDRQEACRRAFFRFLETDRYVNLGLVFDVYSNEPTLSYYRCQHDREWYSVSKISTLNLREAGPDLKYTSLDEGSFLHRVVGGWHGE